MRNSSSYKIKSNRLRLVKKKLANMVFQAQLGTLWNKSERIAKLAVAMSPITGAMLLMLRKQHYY